MVSKAWRVRFAPSSHAPVSESEPPAPGHASPGRRQPRSRAACRECKLRRVKCDEAYPVCRHCARRGTVCVPAPRKTIWKLEMPLLLDQQVGSRDGTASSALLQYYFERVCHIMVLDPEINPLALPLLGRFRESSALLHVVQSIAAAHRHGFNICDSNAGECLVERRRTLSAIQQELLQARSQPVSSFLAIFLLGISSPWIEGTTGLEHLLGARAVIDLILGDPTADPCEPSTQLILGIYIWWEMAASFNLDDSLHNPLHTDSMYKAVHANRLQYHPLAGYSLEMFYMVANLNRYCRRVVDGQARDLALEAMLEDWMLRWTPNREDELLYLLSDAYRKHGLIQLHRICGPNQKDSERESERLIQQWAGEAMENLLQIPLTSPYLNFQPIPLLSGASEIPAHNLEQREEVKARFRAIYSLNTLPVMLDAIALLEEVWELRSLGITTPWLVILLERGQVFPLA
ncbi:fungal-specific transcription factor domain-containing protein [Dactylonectria estremocensis]|uniref:Fungal-specific transcription factor domain-containing protein n=1 Tax=Dactylonectria estremocensis TaxID=1079267 RepID=A0A9P9J3D6_9HYPO|nr:fungal-specific transcription factor domain-containing protein [Dactylonectria estremocensis]